MDNLNIKTLDIKHINRSFLQTLGTLKDTGLEEDIEKAREILEKRKQTGWITLIMLLHLPDDTCETIGTACYHIETKFLHKGGKVCHVEDVAVRPDWQGKGVGTALLRGICNVATQMKCYKIILDCGDLNRGFYEKIGYHPYETMMRKDIPCSS